MSSGTTYGLNFTIDQQGLNQIYAAGQQVTIVKSVGPVGPVTVAWLAFQPLGSDVVTWIEQYNLYATTTELIGGATIVMTSQTANPVNPGYTYEFNDGQFLTGTPGGTPGAYTVNDQQSTPSLLNFGLAQTATINGSSVLAPLNAVPVLFNEQASFTPIETVSIFLSANDNNGVVMSSVSGNALVVTLTSTSPAANIGFDDQKNTFFLAPATPFRPFADIVLKGGGAGARAATAR